MSENNHITKLTTGMHYSFLAFIAVLAVPATAQWDTYPTCGASRYADAGRPDPGLSTEIVGGWNARRGEWPWQVSMRHGDGGATHFCGGSVLNANTIITAAHCCDGEVVTLLKLAIGEHNTLEDDIANPDRVVIDAMSIIMHESYGPVTLINDICLVTLVSPVIYNDFRRSVCSPELGNAYSNDPVSVSGWGSINRVSPEYPFILQTVNFFTLDNGACDAMMREFDETYFVTADMICAGNAPYNTQDSCGGDSGGPMVTAVGSEWRLAGLVSWGTPACASGYPGVYCRVAHFLDWIAITLP